MKSRAALAFSVILNLLALGYWVSHRGMPEAPAALPAASALHEEPRREKTRTIVVPGAPAEKIDWRNIESEDYRKYIANLKTIGCPEETIRDLIIGDLNKLFAPRYAALAVRLKDFKTWQPGASVAALKAGLRQSAAQLDREKSGVLTELLGRDAMAEYRKSAGSPGFLEDEIMLAGVPREKRDAVREVLERSQDAEREAAQKPAGTTVAKNADTKKIQDQRRSELAKILTPAEMEDYELWNASTGESLRTRLAGTQVTEDQFRQLFRLQKGYDDQYTGLGATSDMGLIARRMQGQTQLDTQFKEVLGDQQYADFKRGLDPAFRGLTDVARDFSLPTDTPARVYDIKRAVDDQVNRVLTDQSLSREARNDALKEIATSTEGTLRSTLGDSAFEAYKQNGGSWIPSFQDGTFQYATTSADGANTSVRSYRMNFSDNGNGALTPSAAANAARLLVVPGPAKP
jgi:hypothetical protein